MAQMLKMLMPPTWGELMADPVYAGYVKRRPRLPVNVANGEPWLVIARRYDGDARSTWALKRMPDYVTAYRRVMGYMDDHPAGPFEDVAIVSLRKLWKPPVGFTWNQSKFSWCGRCRRPSMFRHMDSHPALRGAVVLATEDANRCYYCGAREIFAGRERPRRKQKVVT